MKTSRFRPGARARTRRRIAAEVASVTAGQKLIYSWIGKRQDGSTVSWSKIASGAEARPLRG